MKNPFSLIRDDLPKTAEDLSLAELQGDLAKYLIRPYKETAADAVSLHFQRHTLLPNLRTGG